MKVIELKTIDNYEMGGYRVIHLWTLSTSEYELFINMFNSAYRALLNADVNLPEHALVHSAIQAVCDTNTIHLIRGYDVKPTDNLILTTEILQSKTDVESISKEIK